MAAFTKLLIDPVTSTSPLVPKLPPRTSLELDMTERLLMDPLVLSSDLFEGLLQNLARA